MLYSALIFGLISSLHCIGMCGPIALMLPVDRNNPTKRALQIVTYHIGRLTAYGSLGLLFGLLGKGFFMAGMQQQLSIIAGVLMIVVIVIPEKIFAHYNFSRPVYKIISAIKTSLGNQFKNRSYKSFFTIGLLNGYLPCGIVYVALFGAIAMENEWLGVIYMLLFGLGTIPLMTGMVYISKFLTLPLRNKLQKVIPIVTIFIGFLFIIRGLGLNIPYLSPSNLSLFVQSTPNCH
jgi:sulfite exporter TauE/SafE